MSGNEVKSGGSELRLKFVNGSCMPFALHELVTILRHPKVMGLTCIFAVLLALPKSGAFTEEVGLWARILLNLLSVGLFALVLPALMREAYDWAIRRSLRWVHASAITLPAALITTLAIEALVVFIIGYSEKSRWDLAVKLALGMSFWELHVTMILVFLGPAIRAKEAARKIAARAEGAPEDGQIRIGNSFFLPERIDRIETDGHFLTIHTGAGTTRVLASMSSVLQPLERFGLQVHRCHWVAFRELGDVRRNGRSFVMVTRSGQPVAVARDRRKSVDMAAGQDAAA